MSHISFSLCYDDSGSVSGGCLSADEEDERESSEAKSQSSMKTVEQSLGMRVGPILERVSLGKGEAVFP